MIQLEGSTAFEQQLYSLCLVVASDLPAGPLATYIGQNLSEACSELQRLRRQRDQALHVLHRLVQAANALPRPLHAALTTLGDAQRNGWAPPHE